MHLAPREEPPASEQASGGPRLESASLRRLFLDLLGRPPHAAERETWTGQERSRLIEPSLSSEEFWTNWLEEQLYYFLLIDNFRPTTEGVRSIPGELAGGVLGVREALHRICLSSSFDRRNPGPDTFVTVVMEQLLGLVVQKAPRELEIGKKLYDGRTGTFLGRSGTTQADVVHNAIADTRMLTHLLTREHERLLRRPPSAQELAAWVAELERDAHAFRAILTRWFLSKAYDQRLETRAPMPNRLFIRALFVDLLGRLPDEGETHRMRTALDGLADSGPLRALVARLILDSGKASVPERAAIADPAAWIQGLFERLLGRAPSNAERVAFGESFADPDCRPATVLYAIVSHPEYQTW